MLTHRTTLRVRYADTDKMQFVYNGKYLEYFEVGRTELLRHCGLAYRQVEERGYQLPVIEAGLIFRQPAHYDDLLEIEATVRALRTPRLRIEYAVRRSGEEAILVQGFTVHIFMNVRTRRATRPPAFFLAELAPYFAGGGVHHSS
ncbi:MAG: acyl-CoA thioesterase [Acidobacteria bacterium]|nr:acyl-CoA thioesterase [Acidobacteriota bacterium]